jgi:hypothetical protein
MAQNEIVVTRAIEQLSRRTIEDIARVGRIDWDTVVGRSPLRIQKNLLKGQRNVGSGGTPVCIEHNRDRRWGVAAWRDAVDDEQPFTRRTGVWLSRDGVEPAVGEDGVGLRLCHRRRDKHRGRCQRKTSCACNRFQDPQCPRRRAPKKRSLHCLPLNPPMVVVRRPKLWSGAVERRCTRGGADVARRRMRWPMDAGC